MAMGRLEELCKEIVGRLGAKACIIVVVGPGARVVPGTVEFEVETNCVTSMDAVRYLPSILRKVAEEMEEGVLPPPTNGGANG